MRDAPKVVPDSPYRAVVQGSDSGFPRRRRLRKTDEFSSVFSFKCSVSGAHLQVLAKPNQAGYARLGVIVGKRTLRRATARNYAKRVVRELFRRHQQELGALDVVVRVHRAFTPGHFDAVQQELKELFSRSQKCLTRSAN
jgi:ribonuclease P protein component